MSFLTWFGSQSPRVLRNRPVAPRKAPTRQPRRLSVERLEDRVTPSLLAGFELDGNTTTGVLGSSGSTATSHDWDQVFADNNTVPPTTSGALASSFVTDAVNSNTVD